MHHARFTAANVHDSQEMDALLHGQEKAAFADKARDSADRRRGIFYGGMGRRIATGRFSLVRKP